MDTHISPATNCCPEEDCGKGLRNHYFPGKKLTPRSLSVEQRYHLERRKLINRAVHGYGVVYGFGVKIDGGRLGIGGGLAFDRPGRELVEEHGVAFGVDDLIALDDKGRRLKAGKCPSEDERGHKWPVDRCWLLTAHYAERDLARMDLRDPCSCSRTEWSEVCETVRYSLTPVSCGECCKLSKCGLSCECAKGPCCDDKRTSPADGPKPDDPKYPRGQEPVPMPHDLPHGIRLDGVRPAPAAGRIEGALINSVRDPSPPPVPEPASAPASIPAGLPSDGLRETPTGVSPRGGCRCLCDHLARLPFDPGCEPLTTIEEPCGRVRVDLRNGVPLACVKLVRRGCEWFFLEVYDDCGPRPLVKRNDLLFDLIQGCDLTRIEHVGWERWHRRRMSWEDFKASFGEEIREDYALTARYWFLFSKPIRRETLTADAFEMTIVIADQPGGWRRLRRVPVIDVFTYPRSGPTAQVAALVVDGDWVSQQIRGRQTDFTRCCEIWVEIRVHADYLVDCIGQRIDGSVPGMQAAPTGRVKSGGDLFSSFEVEPPDANLCRPYTRRRLEKAQGA